MEIILRYRGNPVSSPVIFTSDTYLIFLHHCKNHIVYSEIIHHACFNIMSTMQRLNHT